MNNLGLTIWKHTVLNPSVRCEKYRDSKRWVACVILRNGKVKVSKHKTQGEADGAVAGYDFGKDAEIAVVLSPEGSVA